MGTSFTEFAGYGFWARDNHVAVWLCLLVRQIDKENDGVEWKHELRQQFVESGTAYPPGCVYTGLDKFIDNNEKREWMITLSWKAFRELDALKGSITIEQLRALSEMKGNWEPHVTNSEPVSITFYREFGEKWIKLLEGNFETKTDAEWNDIVVKFHDFNSRRG